MELIKIWRKSIALITISNSASNVKMEWNGMECYVIIRYGIELYEMGLIEEWMVGWDFRELDKM